ncbi:hypothetical protein [Chelativorans sp. AA-79]|uniref:hypothetical protein n=1 Tax=Chelativorans sp. AA-79 TaxID=3028735 RepID=UPI0023F6DE7B|nr:hypothetical protein [Chelativorans sp. AA-79]WEX09295.1 hypothetical protein PVE73_25280 [Chelativorans sp. AA-79]
MSPHPRPSGREYLEKERPHRTGTYVFPGQGIDNAIGKLKRFKRVALRGEKTKRNFASIVALAAAFALVKSAHRIAIQYKERFCLEENSKTAFRCLESGITFFRHLEPTATWML